MSEPLAAIQTTTSTPAGAPQSAGQASTAAIAIGAVALVLLIVGALWALARSRVYERPGLLSLRHAIAEAGYRMSATWAEFADWARLGR
jgi:hypothetical protein